MSACTIRRHGRRAGPIVIYDYQPGVYVRAYWRRAVASSPLLPRHRRAAASAATRI